LITYHLSNHGALWFDFTEDFDKLNRFHKGLREIDSIYKRKRNKVLMKIWGFLCISKLFFFILLFLKSKKLLLLKLIHNVQFFYQTLTVQKFQIK
jgi:hypothetical protein